MTRRREDKGGNNGAGDSDVEDGRDTEQRQRKGKRSFSGRHWLSIKACSITSLLPRSTYLDGDKTPVTKELCRMPCVAREGDQKEKGR